MPNNEIIEAGIDDIVSTVEGCFGQYPFDLGACSTALRNLFGMIVLISFNKEGSTLAFPAFLRTELLPWAEEAVYAMDEIWWDELGSDAIHTFKALLNLDAAIAQFEHEARHSKTGLIEVAPLAAACKGLGFFGGHPDRGRHWLIVYLRRRWGLAGDELNEFAAQLAESSPKWPMPLHSPASSS